MTTETAPAPATTFEPIGPLQMQVMHLLWDAGTPGTVEQIHRALNARPGAKQLCYTTILTVMRNLARRGFLDQARAIGGGRAHLFRPLVNREGYWLDLVRYVRDTAFRGRTEDLRKALHYAEEG